MTTASWLMFIVYLALLLALAYPLGLWIARVADPKTLPMAGVLEKPLYRLAGVKADEGMTWSTYAIALLVFNLIGALFVYGIQRLQNLLLLNPQNMAAVSADSAFNTAISFATNTNWQGYSGESTMSYLTQMLALAVQNYLSAATGIAVVFVLIRAFVARSAKTLGNFWVDLMRVTVYVLLPLSIVFAVFLASQGVVQNFSAYKEVATIEKVVYQQPKAGADGQPMTDAKGQPVMEDASATTQILPMGPAASQIAIKQLGTNGGGFFGVNSAHPYENPTALTNFTEMLAILLIAAALCFTFGEMVRDKRQGVALLAAMTAIFVAAALATMHFEHQGNPRIAALGVVDVVSVTQGGGNMEGKEVRFGINGSALWAAVTTSASNGSVNAMHDSFTPLGGAVPMLLMQLGEVVFGGVGSGLYGMLIFALMTVFIAGLMIGRTPEYLGKKIESFEIKMISIAILVTPLLVLVGTAIALMTDAGRAGIANPGAHGFSEVLYALSSAANNNGSAFAGLAANTPFYNTLLGIVMWLGRFAIIVPVLAIAGSIAAKKRLEITAGTMPTHGPLFVVLLIGTVLIVGALTYIPALALGPIVEHLQLFGTAATAATAGQ